MADKKETEGAWDGLFKPVLAGIVAFFVAASWKSGSIDDLGVAAVLLLLGLGIIFWMFVLPKLRGEGSSPVPTTDSPSFLARPTPKWEDKLKVAHAARLEAAAAAAAKTRTVSAPAPAAAPEPALAASRPKPAPAPAASKPTPAPVAADVGTRPMALDAPRDGSADDLKMIKGVGPRLEKLLHKLGFYHFDQIASWSPEEVAWVDEHLEGFKGRVARDNWVSQASLLSGGGQTAFSSRVAQGEVYD